MTRFLSGPRRGSGFSLSQFSFQVRPDDVSPAVWSPRHTYNLTSDRSIPYNTFAKAVVDTASSLGQAGDKGFFKNQAQIHIAAALETLREIRADVTLENAYSLLLDQGDLDGNALLAGWPPHPHRGSEGKARRLRQRNSPRTEWTIDR
jgi:hypothetical protein